MDLDARKSVNWGWCTASAQSDQHLCYSLVGKPLSPDFLSLPEWDQVQNCTIGLHGNVHWCRTPWTSRCKALNICIKPAYTLPVVVGNRSENAVLSRDSFYTTNG